MFSNRFFVPILVIAIVGIAFGVWRIASKEAPEVKKIYRPTLPETSEKTEVLGKENPDIEKVEIGGSKLFEEARKRQIFSNFTDTNGDGVISFVKEYRFAVNAFRCK